MRVLVPRFISLRIRTQKPLLTVPFTTRKMSTKTIAVLDDAELQDGQMKEVAFEDGKVLISRLGDKIHATSAFCTHYGAPLAKGVLTSDGRVVCPWHGACFKLSTGDIEDAPAPSAIHSFKAHVADGKIHVTANPTNTLKENKARQPKLLSSGSDSVGKGVIIVGGGSGAFQTVESLREHGYKAPITILSKETYTPIDRTKLSKALSTDPTKVEWLTAAELKIKYGTTIRLGVEVTSIDFAKKQVILDGGKDALSYEKLVLATGGTPRRLPVEGAQLENVYTFRGISDSQKVDAAAKEGKRLVVIGSSFISMEIVTAVAKRKLASIDVIGMEAHPFEAILGTEVGAGLQKYHESQGVKFHMQTKVEKIVPQEGNANLASGVVINGTTIPADFIVMGVGVAPATEFLKGTGVELEKDGGVKVDKYLRVQNSPDKENVYAIGAWFLMCDIAIYPQISGDFTRIEHWNVAGNHGRAVGKTIAGSPQPFVKIPVFWSAQGQQLRYCGVGHGYDDVVVKGDPGAMKFIAYYGKQGKVVAVAREMVFPAHIQAPWKGKGKATDQDFEDLDPTITYRHLYAQNLGIRDPLRVIALCDSDAFYAACEMVRLGTDKNTPLVVLQWDAPIAVNYPARKYGISRMKRYNFKELKEKHPDLLVVHVATYKEGEKEPGYWDDVDTKTHKVSLDYYRRESLKIAAMFKECLPGVEIEKASIDEAFFDFSKRVREILLERYPYLAQVPPDAPNGVDTPLPPPPTISWNKVGYMIPVNPAPPEKEKADGALTVDALAEGSSIKEEASTSTDVDGEVVPMTWHDVALSIGSELIGKARHQVHERLGYSTSAGIARNKFLAKLTASYKKPNSQSILRNAAIPKYLRPLSFQKIRYLGGKLGTAIAKEFEVNTVGDLLSISLDEMQRKFGEDSIWIYEILRGIDRSEVKEKSTLNKSMLASKNLPNAITNASEGFHWIRVLAAELALRLNEARKASPNLWPKSIVLHARRGYEAGRSKQAPFPFTREVTVDTIAAAGDKLWKELVGTELAMKVTNVQLAFTGIEGAEAGQQSIEGFFKQPAKRPRGDDVDDDDDGVRRIFIDGSLTDKGNDISTIIDGIAAQDRSSGTCVPSFVCSRCGETISSPFTSIDEEEELAVLRLEHDDFHFAQDLAKESTGGMVISGPSKSVSGPMKGGLGPSKMSSPKKKRRKEPQATGIEKFFRRS
ncbi:hypothetical protein D9615_004300 [Tricholomella constricta]|uniref:DNA polymerase eta n=1 Tax=Tricholomella constricta TaxID=117010 RepID=A0A8H5HF23_9AGAR|nr:hypothetical protein D9615_004300 [Tricholomella constricta]